MINILKPKEVMKQEGVGTYLNLKGQETLLTTKIINPAALYLCCRMLALNIFGLFFTTNVFKIPSSGPELCESTSYPSFAVG